MDPSVNESVSDALNLNQLTSTASENFLAQQPIDDTTIPDDFIDENYSLLYTDGFTSFYSPFPAVTAVRKENLLMPIEELGDGPNRCSQPTASVSITGDGGAEKQTVHMCLLPVSVAAQTTDNVKSSSILLRTVSQLDKNPGESSRKRKNEAVQIMATKKPRGGRTTILDEEQAKGARDVKKVGSCLNCRDWKIKVSVNQL